MRASGGFLFLSGGAHRALDPAAQSSSGGAELQVALLAKELAARGRRCVLAVAGGGFEDGVEWSGVKVRAAGHFDTGRPIDTLAALIPVCGVLASERPAYVVVYGWTSWLAVLCVLRKILRFRVIFVCALDGEIGGSFRSANPVRGALFEWGMRRSDARFSITEAQAKCFRAQGMTCAVTRLLLPEPPTASSGPHPKTIDLLWVARCHPVKRPDTFLDLAEALPSIRCRMICSPQDRELWERVRARAASLANVEFLEGVPYRDIQSHFDVARIFVNTSVEEGVPNTFLHSASGGAAIVSLDSDPDGMLSAFGCGFSAGGSLDSLKKEISRLLADPEALTALSAGGARFLHTWHDNAGNVEKFLEELPQ